MMFSRGERAAIQKENAFKKQVNVPHNIILGARPLFSSILAVSNRPKLKSLISIFDLFRETSFMVRNRVNPGFRSRTSPVLVYSRRTWVLIWESINISLQSISLNIRNPIGILHLSVYTFFEKTCIIELNADVCVEAGILKLYIFYFHC